MNEKFYIQLSDTTSQIPTTILPMAVKFNAQDLVSGIGHDFTEPTDIVVLEDGVYFAMAAGQTGRKSGSLLRSIDLWFRVNGVDVPNSAARTSAPASLFTGDTFVAVTQSMFKFSKGDILNVYMAVSSPDDDLGLMSTSSMDRPCIPSIIFTMYKI